VEGGDHSPLESRRNDQWDDIARVFFSLEGKNGREGLGIYITDVGIYRLISWLIGSIRYD
jgi:hypothetical protein